MSEKNRDKTYAARTHVIGIIDSSIKDNSFYLKKDVLKKKIVLNKEAEYFLLGHEDSVNAFKLTMKGKQLQISFENGKLIDTQSETIWNIRGKYVSGSIKENLQPIAISDEYWFSWKKYHPNTKLIPS